MAKGWTEEEKTIFFENYRKNGAVHTARLLGKSVDAVRSYASRNNVVSKYTFTKEEEQYLLDYVGIRSIYSLSKKLGRSVSSVANKLKRLGIDGGYKGSTEMLHINEIVRLTGCSKSTVRTTWANHGFVTKKIGSFRVCSMKQLFEFMKNNPERYNPLKCEKWFFMQEQWFQKRYKEEIEKKTRERWKYIDEMSKDKE